MSFQWFPEGSDKKYWVKTGKDYVELHLNKQGVQKRLVNLTKEQVRSYEENPSLLLKG